jgi:uncharacterized Zn finger protein (UPF0148 family)
LKLRNNVQLIKAKINQHQRHNKHHFKSLRTTVKDMLRSKKMKMNMMTNMVMTMKMKRTMNQLKMPSRNQLQLVDRESLIEKLLSQF